ncbi:hypothetical protein BDZ89DRAFT_1039088 [Hymenopellis radicata]|nr:hypothetical protein BDZ89DRAFT_1039088 [Hymenopellis radicata]
MGVLRKAREHAVSTAVVQLAKRQHLGSETEPTASRGRRAHRASAPGQGARPQEGRSTAFENFRSEIEFQKDIGEIFFIEAPYPLRQVDLGNISPGLTQSVHSLPIYVLPEEARSIAGSILQSAFRGAHPLLLPEGLLRTTWSVIYVETPGVKRRYDTVAREQNGGTNSRRGDREGHIFNLSSNAISAETSLRNPFHGTRKQYDGPQAPEIKEIAPRISQVYARAMYANLKTTHAETLHSLSLRH